MSWLREIYRRTMRRFKEVMGVVRKDRTLWSVFVSFLVMDIGWTLWWIVVRIMDNHGIRKDLDLYDLKFLRIDADGGLPEIFNYIKIFMIVVLMVILVARHRKFIYLALALLFTVVLLDDSLGFHEKGGELMADWLGLEPMWGMRDVDFGEVITWALIGLVIMPVSIIGLKQAKPPDSDNAWTILMTFAWLLFFAIFIDQFYHIARDWFPDADVVLGSLEDGGEMVSITFASAISFALVKCGTSCGVTTDS